MDIPGQKPQPLKLLSYDFNLRLTFVLLLTHIYIILFKQLGIFLEETVTLISLIPVVLAGWFLGIRGGLAVALLFIPLNTVLQNLHFPGSLFQIQFIFLLLLNIFIGGLVGWLSDSLEKLKTNYQEKLDIKKIVKQRTAQLEEERSRLESSINSLNIGFIITDSKNNIVNMNSTAKRLLYPTDKGNEANAGVMLDPLAISSKYDIDDVIKQLKGSFDFKKNLERCYRERQLIDVGEIDFRGVFLHILMSPIVLFENSQLKIIGTVILIEDTTQKTMLERSKDEFFSIASHELRTPLTSIRGNSALIKDHYAAILKKDKNLAEMVDDIHQSSVRLIDIVNDFLDTSRLEQGHMVYKKSEFSLKDLAEEVIKELGVISKEKKLKLKLKLAADVSNIVADRDKVKQVLINLVGNSLKFTEKGSVVIELSKFETFAKVSIIDTGRGIDPQNQKLLFRKFQQANSDLFTRDTTKGTGLGLYIAKRMIIDMGGHMRLEKSELGKGSTFTFNLPLVKNSEKQKNLEKNKLSVFTSGKQNL